MVHLEEENEFLREEILLAKKIFKDPNLS